jgi:hypothetical protein
VRLVVKNTTNLGGGRTQREKEGTEKSYSPQRHRVRGDSDLM